MNRKFPLGFVILSTFLLARAETPLPPKTPLPSGLTEEITVEMVQLNLLATDRKGNPVTDLRPEEILIEDHGKRQRVTYLQRVSAPEKPVPPLPLDQRPLVPQPESTGPWNVPDHAPAPGQRLVFFFDNFLSSQRTKIKSVQAARSLVLEKLSPNDQVAVVSFNGKLEILQDFTRDTAQILEGLDKASVRWDRAVPDFYEELDDLVEYMERCERAVAPVPCAQKRADSFIDQRRRDANAILEALIQFIRALSPIQDIKSLLFFSDGIPRNPEAEASAVSDLVLGSDGQSVVGLRAGILEDTYRELISAASQARVTIFSIYPGGQGKTSAISARRRDPITSKSNRLQIDIYRRAEANNQQGIEYLAFSTGGSPMRSAEIEKSLKRVINLTAGLYTIGFKPVGVVGEKTHNLKISCARKGVEITTRREIRHRSMGQKIRGSLAIEAEGCSPENRRRASLRLTLERGSLLFREVNKERQVNLTLGSRILAPGGEVLFDQLFVWNVPEVDPKASEGSTSDPIFNQELVVPCRPLVVDIQISDIGSDRHGDFSGSLAP